MDKPDRSRLDEWLELLADEVAARLEARSGKLAATPEPPQPVAPTPSHLPPPDIQAAESAASTAQDEGLAEPTRVAGSHAAALMARLALGLLAIIVLINIPLNSQGTALARSIPSSAALVIANGLLVKEAGSPDVWVYKDNAFHWITSLDAFEQLGYHWQDVHEVEAGFLKRFPSGRPLSVLLKCDRSPHIYLLEGGRKHWIVDIPTLEAQGYVWGDVKLVSCALLRALPEGDSVPPGRGAPPPPLP